MVGLLWIGVVLGLVRHSAAGCSSAPLACETVDGPWMAEKGTVKCDESCVLPDCVGDSVPIQMINGLPHIGCSLRSLYACEVDRRTKEKICKARRFEADSNDTVYRLPTMPNFARRCTLKDFEALRSSPVQLSLYKFLMLSCEVQFCAADQRLRLQDGPCYSLTKPAPQILPRYTKRLKYCAPYAETRSNCQPLPICWDDPVLAFHGLNSMPLVAYNATSGELETRCETLCSLGSENQLSSSRGGRKCRRIPSTPAEDEFGVGIYAGWCGTFESLQKTLPDCNRRPMCGVSGAVPKDSLGSTSCLRREQCVKKQEEKFTCNFRPVLCTYNNCTFNYCPQYTTDRTPQACTMLPLCDDDSLRGEIPSSTKCEALCNATHNDGVGCRRLPSIGHDEFGVITRLILAGESTLIQFWFKDLNAAQFKYGDPKAKELTPENFEGLPWCSIEQSSLQQPPPKFCNPRPLCSQLKNPANNPFFGTEKDCIPEFRGCNATEAEMYFCSNATEKPWCPLYELNPKSLEKCQRRLLCEDVEFKMIRDRVDVYLLEFYQTDCEQLCKSSIRTPASAEGWEALKCRPLPSRNFDHFGVAHYDGTRLREFCSVDDSQRLHPPSDCNPLPFCTNAGEVPTDPSLNPYMATTCITVRHCLEEEKITYLCSMDDAGTAFVVYGIMAVIGGVFILIIGYLIIKIMRQRNRKANTSKILAPTKRDSSRSESSRM